MSLSGQLKRPFNGQLLHCPECLEHTDTSLSDQTTLQNAQSSCRSKSSDASSASMWCDEDCLEDAGWAANELTPAADTSLGCNTASMSADSVQPAHGCVAQQQQELQPVAGQHQQHQQSSGICSCSSISISTISSVPATNGITPMLRASVVDSIIKAAHRLELGNDTLFLAVACLDRYLAVQWTDTKLVQPVGIACLWVASKFLDSMLPASVCFAAQMVGPQGVPMGRGQAELELLLQLEVAVLNALDFRLADIVTSYAEKHGMIERYWGTSACAGLSAVQRLLLLSMTSYLSEAMQLEYNLLPYTPAAQAAAAFACAHVLLGLPLDDGMLKHVTGYTLGDLSQPLLWLFALHTCLAEGQHQGTPYYVTTKYTGHRAGGVANVAPILGLGDKRLRRVMQGAPGSHWQQQQGHH